MRWRVYQPATLPSNSSVRYNRKIKISTVFVYKNSLDLLGHLLFVISNSHTSSLKTLQRYNFYLNYPTFPHKKNIHTVFNNFSTNKISHNIHKIKQIYIL